jgi:uncharacterized protein DUF1707
MVDTDALRASDRDRQDVVDRLRGAVGDGRLRMDEYMERMEIAYEAVTLGDLAPLCADLPVSRPVAAPKPPAARALARTALAGWSRLPCWLQVLWAIWLTSVLVNVVVWVLVSVTTGHFPHPWPLWVAGPYGAALFAISMAVSRCRSMR